MRFSRTTLLASYDARHSELFTELEDIWRGMSRKRFRALLRSCAKDNNGLAGSAEQTLIFENFEYAPGHFARTSDDARQLLPRDPDLGAIRVRKRIRLAAQIEQGLHDAAADIQKCQA